MNKSVGALLRRVLALSLLMVAVAINSPPAHATPLAIGVVDSVDKRAGTISVLGQRIRIDSAQLVAGSRTLPASKGVSLLAPDAVVWVDGTVSRGVAHAERVYVLPERNVPGATLLFVAGVLSGTDSTGIATIGQLRVDLNPLGLSDIPAAGSYVEIVGVQPVPRGILLAQGLVSRDNQGKAESGTQGIVGSGLQGIVGSGTQGIVGSGTQGIVGSGTQGIVGSGTQGIVGSGTQGIVGSGTQGIVGSGTQGIVGSGLQGIVGSGTQGIVGSGTQGIVGSGLQGIVGSGTQGIVGSGTQGIVGSGLQGIVGSGTQGIVGSGYR